MIEKNSLPIDGFLHYFPKRRSNRARKKESKQAREMDSALLLMTNFRRGRFYALAVR